MTGPTMMFYPPFLHRLGRLLSDIQPVELSPARSAALRSHGGQEGGGAGRREGRTVRQKKKKKNSPRFSSLSFSLWIFKRQLACELTQSCTHSRAHAPTQTVTLARPHTCTHLHTHPARCPSGFSHSWRHPCCECSDAAMTR